jgi:hypothetical protein
MPSIQLDWINVKNIEYNCIYIVYWFFTHTVRTGFYHKPQQQQQQLKILDCPAPHSHTHTSITKVVSQNPSINAPLYCIRSWKGYIVWGTRCCLRCDGNRSSPVRFADCSASGKHKSSSVKFMHCHIDRMDRTHFLTHTWRFIYQMHFQMTKGPLSLMTT